MEFNYKRQKGINSMNKLIISLQLITVLIYPFLGLATGTCTTEYGGHPCSFVPAPPGRIPPCARPGYTFCEHIDQYPMIHIRYLIDKWGFDYATLFSDETRGDYSTYFSKPDYHAYSSSSGPNAHTNNDHTGYTYNYPSPEPIYIPKPPPGSAPYLHPNNQYIPPSVNLRQNYSEGGFAGYPDRRYPLKYPGYNLVPNGNQLGSGNNHGYTGYQSHHHGYFVPIVGPTGHHRGYDSNPWWRYSRDNKNAFSRSKRSTSSNTKSTKKKLEKLKQNDLAVTQASIHNTTFLETSSKHRSKRQANIGGPQQLCPTRSQYIMPQAAVNSQGNWMYVVNIPEQNNRFTQLVRSETCVSQTCNGLCSVPTGYTARCEQRYVQKRLVALDGGGQNLYNDVFWFPSCCICTFTGG